MKKIFTIIAVVILTTSVFAQVPQKMNYQAVIRDAGNTLITNHAVGMQISILQGSATGTPVYIETQTPTTNANGLVTIEIGEGTGFDAINWSNGPFFIKTETDPTGGTSYTITGTSQLSSVPYALYAKTVASYTETDPIFGAWNKSTDISITASQVSDFQTNVTNNSAVLANTAKNSYPTADATKLAGIAAGAEVNVNVDWNAATGDAKILNKPTTITGYGITDAVNTTGNQTIAGNKTFSGITTVITPVNPTDATNKAYVDELKAQIKSLEDNLIVSGIYRLSDIEGNQYKVVKIGNQVWMAENLKTIKYNDGTAIPFVTDGAEWAGLITPAYCWYNNDGAAYKAAYGALYNWYSVNTGNLCPTGWHVPTDAEWTTLTTYLGGETVAGGKLKESGTAHWASPNSGTNESGFTALPGGYRYFSGSFLGIGNFGNLWSSTEFDEAFAWYRFLYYMSSDMSPYNIYKYFGFSVRCIKDN
jgi:uncharacterized protein (TIGR02145 family)